jgi:hypothetical protein
MIVFVKVRYNKVSLIYRISEVIHWKGGNTYRKFRDFKKENKFDVIVIGSSHAYRGYDPRIFAAYGEKMFNLGTSAQSLINSYFISKNYVNSQNCGLVILDIYDGALAVDGLEATADLIENISSDKAAFEMACALKDPRALNMLAVRILTQNEPEKYYDSTYVTNGYSERNDSLAQIDLKDYQSVGPPNSRQFQYLEKLVYYLKSNSIKVVLVTHPFPKEKKKEDHLLYSSIVNKLCLKYDLKYLDYSFSHNLNSQRHFYDSNHLNQKGVTIFNEMLLKDLKKMRIL